MTLRIVSFGGGQQSTAMLVLAAEGKIDFPRFLFANVGDDSENPATLAYVREVAMPYAQAHGIELTEIARGKETLLQWAMRSERSVYLPLRTAGGFPGNRSCTQEYKIKVIARWQKQHGATADNPAITALGISTDEFTRMRSSSQFDYQQLAYPLIDLRLSRADCRRVIAAAGLPVPDKSACYFCPFHRLGEWQAIRRDTPDLFFKACQLEQTMSQRSVALGRPAVFLTRYGRPLDQVVGDQAVFDFGEPEESCDVAGYCRE